LRELLSFPEFADSLREALDLPKDTIRNQTDQLSELGLDSLHMFEIVILLDELDTHLVENYLPHMITVGDIYSYYETRLGQNAHGQPNAGRRNV
jgi:acyl carrier protein